MNESLEGKRVAILVADGFEQVELTEPMQALIDAGADAQIVSPEDGQVWGWKHTKWGSKFDVDVALDDARADDFDALVLPGGVMNPDSLRSNKKALYFVREFFTAGKPVAAICHAPWTLIDAGVVKGRKLTSYQTIRADLHNAGANWVDEEAVVDGNLLTSRSPDDLPAFCKRMVEQFATVGV
jgi:protease I